MKTSYIALTVLLGIVSVSAAADDKVTRADTHAPIGVMADHTHKKGEWMLSYRFMSMAMAGNRKDGDAISADEIVTTEANRFFGNPGQPPTLRVVPIDMSMDMHMLGAMYAPSDSVTLMLMLNYFDKKMRHITYQGGMGTTQLGRFTGGSRGLGDSTVAALINLGHAQHSNMHLIAGVSVPTGSTDEQGQVLTPMNMRPTVRLPYPMQLGSGSFDPIVGFNYSSNGERISWGAQWRSTFRSSDNDEGYRLGDEHRLTAWLSYLWSAPLSTSLRIEHIDRGNIDGIDASIMLPVQTADPDRQGGKRTDLIVGANLAGAGELQGWRLALEYARPVAQRLDGPQLETDALWTFGLQRSF